MSQNRQISDLREHLFDAIEQLKNGKMDVKQAIAVAQLGGVLVQSVKVEVDALKVMGGQGSGFVNAAPGLPVATTKRLAAPVATDADGEPPDIANHYGKVGSRYYAAVEHQSGELRLVEIPWRSLKEKVGHLDAVPVYETRDALESRLLGQ